MKRYEEPEIEIMEFELVDICTASTLADGNEFDDPNNMGDINDGWN